MASLSVRKIDDGVCQKLRRRAAKRGVSMEEEVRQILTDAVQAPKRNIADIALHFFGPKHGVTLEIPPRDEFSEPVDFFK